MAALPARTRPDLRTDRHRHPMSGPIMARGAFARGALARFYTPASSHRVLGASRRTTGAISSANR
ncbi:hypothetical protein GCM10010211_51480 [Streptomyces albospinus]|uniref:Uncharacterized protein n=1 Tax=Streptomyces albospinus TaxID=285515 RepID=A0ABQ2VFL7_9ACTN|nr:hypothetical protein GCM10010211_51480 [Streptomyces albospinus]